MENNQTTDNRVTGKQVEVIAIAIIATLVGFVAVKYIILTEITFLQFIGVEFIITGSFMLLGRFANIRKKSK